MSKLVAAAWVFSIFVATCTSLLAAEPNNESQLAPLATHSLLLDVATAGARLVAVGERGHVLLSADQGQSWRQIQVPTQALLTAVFFIDDQHGWIVGHDAVILRSDDGGEHWHQVFAAADMQVPWLDVWFQNTQHGLVVGAYGTLMHTYDGGETWQSTQINDDDDFHLNHLLSLGKDELLLLAESGALYRSEDAGEHWQSLPSPYEGSWFGGLVTKQAVYIFGLRGHLFRSVNRGSDWQALSTSSQALLTDATVLADGRMLIVGQQGSVLYSSDGLHFNLQQIATRPALSAIHPLPGGGFVTVGDVGVQSWAADFSVIAP